MEKEMIAFLSCWVAATSSKPLPKSLPADDRVKRTMWKDLPGSES